MYEQIHTKSYSLLTLSKTAVKSIEHPTTPTDNSRLVQNWGWESLLSTLRGDMIATKQSTHPYRQQSTGPDPKLGESTVDIEEWQESHQATHTPTDNSRLVQIGDWDCLLLTMRGLQTNITGPKLTNDNHKNFLI